jgi:dipeptidyl aminopeptidase/acylaminoacyl peptidase
VAFLPTQLGYKFSEGTPDYCGPGTVKGIMKGVELLKKKNFIDGERIGLWGISRGASVAAMLSIQGASFKAAVLQSGIYDFTAYISMTGGGALSKAILTETNGTPEALKERSILKMIELVQCPYLILHGEADERVPSRQAKLLSTRLRSFGKEHTLVIVPKANHFITECTFSRYTIPFLQSQLQNRAA